MDKIKIGFENCFGINKLNKEFDFTSSGSIVIYASNGTMKTSFANTFVELSKGKMPIDKLFGNPTKCSVEVDGSVIDKSEILVVKSFESISSIESQSKLLVDETSKREYDEINNDLLDKKSKIINELNRKSGVPKKDIEQILLTDFSVNNLFDLFGDIDNLSTDIDYSDFKYSELFHPDVIEFLSKPQVNEKIIEYFDTYNTLIKNSKIFKQGVFSPSKADSISQTLEKENYFLADHKLVLKDEEEPIGSIGDFNKRLLEERKAIVENDELLKIELEIKKVAVKQFRDILEKNSITEEFYDVTNFKKKIWTSYLLSLRFHIDEINVSYSAGKPRLEEIEESAKNQKTTWDSVTQKFNDRFSVPFKATIVNRDSSILGKSTPNIEFVFEKNPTQKKSIKQEEIERQDILSQGEKRAMYLLNVLFNIEAKKNEGKKVFLVVDDIADSFDYKNKYAIVQYLFDIHNEGIFRQLILTHNFDFFRTIQSRLLGESLKRTCSFIAVKDFTEINLIASGSRYQEEPFTHWKKNLNEPIKLIAAIPFVRNLIEFKEGSKDPDYLLLTQLLHQKSDTDTITIGDLKNVFDKVINSEGLEMYNQTTTVKSILDDEASKLITNPVPQSINLEEKIVLSIAIRMKAEKYMFSQVTDKSEIKGSQTGKLFQRFKDEFTGTKDNEIRILDKVNLVTPENIHINAFMFEPIIDLSLSHLVQLYHEIDSL